MLIAILQPTASLRLSRPSYVFSLTADPTSSSLCRSDIGPLTAPSIISNGRPADLSAAAAAGGNDGLLASGRPLPLSPRPRSEATSRSSAAGARPKPP